MKNNPKITAILLTMFLVTQLVGLYVISNYSATTIENGEVVNISAQSLPYGLETPEIEEQSDYQNLFYVILFAFILAIVIIFFLTKIKAEIIFKIWFFLVATLALSISFNSFLHIENSEWIALAVALPLTYLKIFKPNFIVHNVTEIFIYPGIAAIFVPILNFWTILALLVLISIYDMWAVWHSGILQKMAKYQMNNLKILGGFLIPNISKKVREKIKQARSSKSKKKKGVRVNMAVLGGGDICWTLIAAGVIMNTKISLPFGLHEFTGGIGPALFVIGGAMLGLGTLFVISKKKKFYPAMPFITTGIFVGIILSYLIF